jgi:alpha-glucosidase (family GH31 glycosyl hydrolase)
MVEGNSSPETYQRYVAIVGRDWFPPNWEGGNQSRPTTPSRL